MVRHEEIIIKISEFSGFYFFFHGDLREVLEKSLGLFS